MSLDSRGFDRSDNLRQELYSPKEAERILSISHASLYRLLKAGNLDARKIGSKTVITASSIEAFVASLPKVGEPVAA
jgi:hypothetical protein